jgi:hypothetical protein
MFRKALTLTAIILVFSACELQAAVIYSTWVGGAGGSWEEAANWSPAIVPHNDETNTFNVTIAAVITDGNDINIGLTQSHTINRMDCNVTGDDVELEFAKWSLNWIELRLDDPNGLTNYGALYIYKLNVSGNINNMAGASCELCGTTVEIRGNIYNQANAKLELDGDVQLGGDFNLENAGTIWMWGPGVQFYTGGTLSNTGQINLVAADCGANKIINNSSGVIRGWGNICTEDEGELLQNEGLISASGGSLLIVTENNAIVNNGILRSEPGCFLHVKPLFLGPSQADVNNTGKIEVKSGGGVTFYCNLLNQANGEIDLLGGALAATTITQTADANFVGFGSITGDVLIDPNGIIRLTGPTNIVGDVNISPDATLEISDGTTLITGYTICNNGTIRMIGGRIIIQEDFTNNNCNIIWEPGTYSNVADFNLDGTVNFKDFADFADTWLWQASWY